MECGFPHSLCDNITDRGLSTSVEQLSLHGSKSQSAESMVQPQNPQVVSTYPSPSRGPSAGINNCASGWLIVLGIVQILVGVFYTILGCLILRPFFFLVPLNIASGSVAIAGVCTKKQKLFKATQVLSIVSAIPATGLTFFFSVFSVYLFPQGHRVQKWLPLIILFGLLPALTMLITAIISAILASKMLAGRNQNQPNEGVVHVPSPTDFNQEQGVQLSQRLPATERKQDILANEVQLILTNPLSTEIDLSPKITF